MGQQGRRIVIERFPKAKFRENFLRSIGTARRKWQNREVNPGLLSASGGDLAAALS